MLGLSIPSDPYDPDEVERGPKKGQFMSLKGFIAIIAVIVIVVLLILPSYFTWVANGEKAFCVQNMKAIGQALTEYATDNDDRFPPTHYMEADGSPALVKGLPDTWVTKIREHMSERQNFVCPTSKPSERVKSLAEGKGQSMVESSYGFYRGLSSTPRSQIANLADVIAVAETSNNGNLGSYDPVPFGPQGSQLPDGFLIGWDDSNLTFSRATKRVTRLAFYGSGGEETKARHGSNVHQAPSINAVSADGHLRVLVPGDSMVEHSPPRLKGLWWADPNYFK